MTVSTKHGGTGVRRWCVAAVAAITLPLALGACGGSSHGTGGSGSGPITIGELFPFTGAKAEVSSWGKHGVDLAIAEINSHGGVLGRQLQTASADDAADAVDALPALRKLLLSGPATIIGPFSPTIEAVINQFGPNHVVDFMLGGITQLNNMNFPYVFRTTPSDSTEAVAMAYYAISQGYKTASMVFDNSANSQGFVAPLTAAYKKLGGRIDSNLVLVPDQGSYQTELVKTFAQHPQVVFASFDTQTAATLWSNARQLGYLNTPWIGDDLMAGSVYAKAFGPTAPKLLSAATPAPPSGAGYQHFVSAYDALYHTSTPLPITPNAYDAVIIAALAMTQAKAIDPSVWVTSVTHVADPPGKACSDYATCVADIKAGQKIAYEGAGGSNNFNTHHNVFGGFAIVGFAPNLAPKNVAFVTAQQVAQNAG